MANHEHAMPTSMELHNVRFAEADAGEATYLPQFEEKPADQDPAVYVYNLRGHRLEIGGGLTLEGITNQAVEAQITWSDEPPGQDFSAQPPGAQVATIRIWSLAKHASSRQTLGELITQAKDTQRRSFGHGSR